MELKKNLTEYCKVRNLSLAALAKKSGVKQSTLHGWVTGRSVHNLDDLKKVCQVLEVGLHRLLYGEPDPFEKPEEELHGEFRVTIHRIVKG